MPLKDKEARRKYEAEWRSKNKAWKKNWNDSHKAHMKIYSRTHYLENREKRLRRSSELYSKNKASITARHLAYKSKNRDKIIAYNREYISKNKERVDVARRRYNKINKSKIESDRKNWQLRNPHKTGIYSARRRVLRLKATVGNLKVIEDWIERWRSLEAVRCYWCNKMFNPSVCASEHINPLFCGGIHSIENLCISCKSCNCSKHIKPLSVWSKMAAVPTLAI